ncbi:hypothetical protein KA093_00100 [Candidatus Saccharibacteria bacterium]|nr:hypothetical protein [Candidatus Saccharibacteria bacterium]
MWLKKLVAVSMIVTLIGMNAVAAIGIFAPNGTTPGISLSQPEIVTLPEVTFAADPTEVAVGSFGALKWSVKGTVDTCTGSGDWSGAKTPFGSESTGRLSAVGTKTYTLTCANSAGSVPVSVTVTVKAGAVATSPTQPSSKPSSPAQPVYCQGASPCYGPREVAAHASPGNCWGYNANRVINISGFDAAFHQSKSGIGSIEVSGVCGVNLVGALGGSVSAGGQTRNHNNSSKNNADRNMIPYFVGYYDGAKP